MPLRIPPLRIPVFVSCPSALTPKQEASAKIVFDHLERNKLQWRAVGQPDYPRKLPLQEVIGMIRHCAGGVVLGFSQYEAFDVVYRRGVRGFRGGRGESSKKMLFPTPWNHLEAGILYSLDLPILVFHEPDVQGGVFDRGVVSDFTHKMPTPALNARARDELDTLFQRWAGEVKLRYHGKPS